MAVSARQKTRAQRFIERWAAKIDIAREFRYLVQQTNYVSPFEPVLPPNSTLPESDRFSRGRDFEEAYKEIFGRNIEEAFVISEVLGLYKDLPGD